MNITKIQNKLPEFIKKKLTPVIYNQQVIIVNSENDLKKGKEILKEIKTVSKSFSDYIDPIKTMFFETHKMITAFEKEHLAKGKLIAHQQDAENSDYNRRVFDCQKKQENYLKEFNSNIAKMEQIIAQGKLNFETGLNQRFAKQELEKIQSLNVPIAEKIDAIEEARKEVEKPVEVVIVPQIEKPIEKIILKKDEKKEVRSYYITDEKKAIDRILFEYVEATKRDDKDAVNFWKGLLSISLSKKDINEAFKNEEFKALDFVSYKSEWK